MRPSHALARLVAGAAGAVGVVVAGARVAHTPGRPETADADLADDAGEGVRPVSSESGGEHGAGAVDDLP